MSFVKTSSGMVINTDDSAYKAIVAQRESQKQARQLGAQVDSLKSELVEIRALLASITNGNKDG